MQLYIALLRGINVSGQKIIKMDQLKLMFENLGFQRVSTYVQSGNVRFESLTTNECALSERLSAQIKSDFGYEVPVIVLSRDTLQKIIETNPFSHLEPAHLYVTFLASQPDDFDQEILLNKRQEGEALHFADHAIYLYCPNGYGKTKLSNNYIESKLKVVATTRNWKTSNILLNDEGK